MTKRIAVLALALALLAGIGHAELRYTSVSATATAATTTINAGVLVVINDGSNEVYVRVFATGETSADATTASAQIASGESLTFTQPGGISAISIVCASAETATVRLFYW